MSLGFSALVRVRVYEDLIGIQEYGSMIAHVAADSRIKSFAIWAAHNMSFPTASDKKERERNTKEKLQFCIT